MKEESEDTRTAPSCNRDSFRRWWSETGSKTCSWR